MSDDHLDDLESLLTDFLSAPSSQSEQDSSLDLDSYHEAFEESKRTILELRQAFVDLAQTHPDFTDEKPLVGILIGGVLAALDVYQSSLSEAEYRIAEIDTRLTADPSEFTQYEPSNHKNVVVFSDEEFQVRAELFTLYGSTLAISSGTVALLSIILLLTQQAENGEEV